MKFVYLFFFLIFLSCNTIKKEYVCGDHSCIDKKEFKEYFSKNLTIEIKSQDKKKIKSVNLVELNTISSNIKKNDNKNLKKEEKIKKKKQNDKLKAEKVRLLEERKIKKKEEKNKSALIKIKKIKVKNEKLAQNKISNNREGLNEIVTKIPEDKKQLEKIPKKTASLDTVKTENIKSICDEIEDCDIDKIVELLIKKGKDKPFPNISSN